MDKKIDAKYPKLSEAEIKTLVVDDKWMTCVSAAVQGEMDRVSQTLTGRIRQLAERYATPLPKLTDEVETLAARVDDHLKHDGGGVEVRPGYKQTEVGVIPEAMGRRNRCTLFFPKEGSARQLTGLNQETESECPLMKHGEHRSRLLRSCRRSRIHRARKQIHDNVSTA